MKTVTKIRHAKECAATLRLSISQVRPSFVLLTVVVMLAICCTLLAQLAVLSMSEARKAMELEREMQQRWALVSIRRSMLGRAERIFVNRQMATHSAIGSSRVHEFESFGPMERQLTLSGLKYDIMVDDESRKLPLHLLYRFRTDDALDAANRLLQRTGFSVDGQQMRLFQAGDGWQRLLNGKSLGPHFTLPDQVTVWGDGRLNLLRADANVVRQSWRTVFGVFPPNEVLDQESLSGSDWSIVKTSLGLREDQSQLCDRFFSMQSHCFSVVITIDPAVQQERAKWLFVIEYEDRHYGYEL